MTMAKILVPLTSFAQSDVVLNTAFALAHQQSAYVEVVFVHADVREAIPISDMPLGPEIVQELVDAAETGYNIAAKRIRGDFSICAAKWNVKVVGSPEKSHCATATYREHVGHLREFLDEQAPLSDLVVFPSLADGNFDHERQGLLDTLTKHGRPALLCTNVAPTTIGSNALIGWDGGDAAAIALKAALPVLESTGSVRFACVRSHGTPGRSLRDAKEYLALHGIKASESVVSSTTRSIPSELLEIAHKNGNDLLIVGGYGHSRAMETIFGGTTDYLLSHNDVPLFLAH